MDSERFSRIGKSLRSSEIRELMKLAGKPGIVSFAGGLPDADHFPVQDIQTIVSGFSPLQKKLACQYGATAGYPALVESLVQYLKPRGIHCSPENVLITTGAQQGLCLCAKVFMDPGEVAVIENPSFVGGIAAFLSFRASLQTVPLRSSGPDLEHLEMLLKKHKKKVKLLYLIPNFQNPSGITYTRHCRKQVLEIAYRHDVIILEDDPYGELYFKGSPREYRSLKSMDEKERVIYLGTFSKILAPGFRLGFVVSSEPVHEKLELAKQSMDACSPMFSQVIAEAYLRQGCCDRYTAKMRDIYSRKCNAMISALEQCMPDAVTFTRPGGGFYIWLTLPHVLSAKEIFNQCLEKGVAFVTGAAFCIDDSGDKRIRLAFSNTSLADIEKGVRILGEVVKKLL